MPEIGVSNVDYLEAGSGPTVILVHSSVSGARQWRKLMDTLSASFTVRAINLYGYGETVEWPASETQTLDDQAKLVEALIPPQAEHVSLVGHSFGGSVAMMAALRNSNRVDKLVLLEPNPFFLLRDNGHSSAFCEVAELRDMLKHHGVRREWMIAAERFADYWGGEGTWAATSLDRRATFAQALQPNFYEWDAVMNETTPLQSWSDGLPHRTLVVYDPATMRPIREIVELLRGITSWRFETIAEGGHMAPLTRPDLVNPIVEQFLAA